MTKNEIQLLEEISFKLDKLAGMIAIQGKDIQTQAKILRSLGLTLKDVSTLLGIPEGTLKTWEHRVRKEKHKKNAPPTTTTEAPSKE